MKKICIIFMMSSLLSLTMAMFGMKAQEKICTIVIPKLSNSDQKEVKVHHCRENFLQQPNPVFTKFDSKKNCRQHSVYLRIGEDFDILRKLINSTNISNPNATEYTFTVEINHTKSSAKIKKTRWNSKVAFVSPPLYQLFEHHKKIVLYDHNRTDGMQKITLEIKQAEADAFGSNLNVGETSDDELINLEESLPGSKKEPKNAKFTIKASICQPLAKDVYKIKAFEKDENYQNCIFTLSGSENSDSTITLTIVLNELEELIVNEEKDTAFIEFYDSNEKLICAIPKGNIMEWSKNTTLFQNKPQQKTEVKINSSLTKRNAALGITALFLAIVALYRASQHGYITDSIAQYMDHYFINSLSRNGIL